MSKDKEDTFDRVSKAAMSKFARKKNHGTRSGNVLPVFLIAKRDSQGRFTERCSGGVLRELPESLPSVHNDKICLITSGLSDLNPSTYMEDYSLFFLRSDSNENTTKEKQWKKLNRSKAESVVYQLGPLIFIPVKKSRILKDYRQYSVTAMTDVDRRRARLECQIVFGKWCSFEVRTCKLEYRSDGYVIHLGDEGSCKTMKEIKGKNPDFHPSGSVILEKESGTAVGVLSFDEDEICPLFFEPQPVDGRYKLKASSLSSAGI